MRVRQVCLCTEYLSTQVLFGPSLGETFVQRTQRRFHAKGVFLAPHQQQMLEDWHDDLTVVECAPGAGKTTMCVAIALEVLGIVEPICLSRALM